MSVRAKIGQRALDALDFDLQKFLLEIGKRLDAVDDLAVGSTTAQCVTKINEILAALRDADKMVE